MVSSAAERPPCLWVGNFLSGAGRSRQICEEITPRLEARGRVVIRTSSRPGRFPRLIDMMRTTVACRDRYNVAQIDVFSGPSFLWAEAIGVILARLRKPFVLTLRGGSLPRFSQDRPGRVRRLLRSAASVIAPSRYLLEGLREYRPDIDLVPNGIEIAAYPYRRRQHPMPRLVWLRSLHAIYNPVMAVQVLARLVEAYPAARLVIVGPDKGDGTAAAVRNAITTLGMADRVEMTGGVSKLEVPVWLDRGDIFLNTTNVDNAPVSVVEAMACGLCVVSTNVDGLPFLLTGDMDSILVDKGDVDAMTNAVLRILSDATLASTLSRTARLKAECHDWNAVLADWDRLLDSAAAQQA